MKFLVGIIFFFSFGSMYSQLGFCSGSKGDPIFHEDFGQASGTGNELGPGITNYTFVRQDPDDGEYTISDDIGNEIDSWHHNLPQTTISGGSALIVNADFTAGRFYRKEISGLCENTTYEFSAFLMNVYDRDSNNCAGGGIPNNVRFEIWDETDSFLIKSGDTPAIPSTSNPKWDRFALTFQSEAGQGAVILKMFNNGDGGCGNDLAIDDIIFSSCGDLSTITTPDGESYLELCEENTPQRLNLNANTDNSVYEQVFYQWQISLDGENWGDIPGADSSNYQTSQIDDSVYFRVKLAEDENNLLSNFCSAASEAFKVEVLKTPESPVSNGDVTVCENESTPALRVSVAEDESVNWYDSETGGNLLAEDTETYFPIESGTYYAEAIKRGYNCSPSTRTAIKLSIISLPALSDESLKICTNASLSLSAGLSGYDYQWSTGETSESITVTVPGNYSVDVISAQACYTTKDFFVSPVENAEIAEVISNDENIQIIPVINGDFQYSIDGINFQGSSVFSSIPGGVYTAHIKDSENCNIDSLEFAHIVIPKMITPNNDAYNDVFQLKGVEFFDSSQIQIFNRYGKLIKQGSGAGFEWDGTLNGQDLPAADYWYRIKITGFQDNTGNFSLIR